MSFPYTHKALSNADATFTCMKRGGSFAFDAKAINKLHKFVALSEEASQFCLVEKKTEYFRLFWDLDINDELLNELPKNMDWDGFWNFVIETINTILRKYIKGNKATFQYIYSDRTDFKHKLHLYYPNIVLNGAYCMLLRKDLLHELSVSEENKGDDGWNLTHEDYKKVVDDSVFKANGIRLLYQVKKGQVGHYKINIDKSTVKDLPTDKVKQLERTSIRTTMKIQNVDFITDDAGVPLIEEIKEEEKVKQTRKVNQGKEIDEVDLKAIADTTYDMEMVEKLVNNLSLNRIKVHSTWLLFVFLCRNYGWVDLAHEISAKTSNYSKSKVNELLRSKPKGGIITIYSLIRWSKEDNPEEHEKIMSDSRIENLVMEAITCPEEEKDTSFEEYADHVYEKKYVQHLNLKYNTFIIKAATGTGKTETIISAIKELVDTGKADSITVLASRIVLAENIAGRFKGKLCEDNRPINLKMKVYTEIERKEDLKKEKRLIQTPDSLVHMIDEEGNITYPDVLFIDEIESLYNYVSTSDTLARSRREVFTILNAYICNAKYVFLVDSNVTTKMCEYVKKLRSKEKVQVIFNKKETNKTNYYLVPRKTDWNQRLVQYVKEGKKVFIGSDSKNQTDKLETLLKDLCKVKVYNSDTDDDSKKALGDVNKEWVKYDVVICSPTILYGVDFNMNHFDYIFGFYQQTILASSVYQQLNRARETSSGESYIFIETRFTSPHPKPVTTKEIGKYFFRYKEEFKRELDCLAVDETTPNALNEENLFTQLYLHFQVEENKCYNDYVQQLAKYLTEFGGKFNKLRPSSMTKAQRQAMNKEDKMLASQVKKESITALTKASESIDKVSAINHMAKSKEDKKILEASKYCKKLHLQELSESFLETVGHKNRDIEILYNSFNYFGVTTKKDDLDGNFTKNLKRISLLQSANKLFWGSEGILSTEKVCIIQNTPLTPEQLKWWTDNQEDIYNCFAGRIDKCVKEVLQKHLFDQVERINKEFFGSLITFESTASRPYVQVNGKKTQVSAKTSTIKMNEWVELFLNARITIDEVVIAKLERFSKQKCTFAKLHKHKTIGDLLQKHKPVEMIDDEEDPLDQ